MMMMMMIMMMMTMMMTTTTTTHAFYLQILKIFIRIIAIKFIFTQQPPPLLPPLLQRYIIFGSLA